MNSSFNTYFLVKHGIVLYMIHFYVMEYYDHLYSGVLRTWAEALTMRTDNHLPKHNAIHYFCSQL